MSPQIKVTYFDSAGRAEFTRLVLTVGGVEFEDERIQHAEFPALKPTLPLGQIPVLTVDGAVYPQSMAISRFVARLGDLYPTDPLEALKVDTVSETLNDAFNTMVDIVRVTKDEAVKAEKTKKFVEEGLPLIYGFIEKMIAGKFLLGDKMSSADVQLFNFTTNGLSAFKDFQVSAFPKIVAIVEAVKAHPNVVTHLAKNAK